jgi:hypothetical protein
MPPFSFLRWRSSHQTATTTIAAAKPPLQHSQMSIDSPAASDGDIALSDISDPLSIDGDDDDDGNVNFPVPATPSLNLNLNFDYHSTSSSSSSHSPRSHPAHAFHHRRVSFQSPPPRRRRTRTTAAARAAGVAAETSAAADGLAGLAHGDAYFRPQCDHGFLLVKQKEQQTQILAGSTLPSRPSHPPRPCRIFDLDDDVLLRVVHFVMSPVRVAAADRIVERSYIAALPLASVSKRFNNVFYASLRDLELWQTASIPGPALSALAAKAGDNIKRIVLRNCAGVTAESLLAVADRCTALRTLDVSHIPAVDDIVIASIFEKRGSTLRSLLARGCTQITDVSLHAMAHHATTLDAIDMASLPAVTDEGMLDFLTARGGSLISIVCSSCPALTDTTFRAIGAHCTSLEVLCARALPAVTNQGIHELCSGVGDRLEVLDVLECEAIMVNRFLESVGTFCPRLASRFMDGQGRTLKQVIISSLPGFIFHVTGRDAYNGRYVPILYSAQARSA